MDKIGRCADHVAQKVVVSLTGGIVATGGQLNGVFEGFVEKEELGTLGYTGDSGTAMQTCTRGQEKPIMC